MKVKSVAVGRVISKDFNVSQKDNTTKYYNLGCQIEKELGMISCTEEVYNYVVEGVMYDLICLYSDGKYTSFRVVSAVECKPVK